jgi:hypothetical protein
MTKPKITTRRQIKMLPRRKKTELKALTEQLENVNNWIWTSTLKIKSQNEKKAKELEAERID